jgi:hypothetical protein
MVKVAVAGKELTEAGLMLQLPAPYVVGQLRFTAPVKSSCEAIENVPLVPVLPTFTSGNEVGPVRMKSGCEITSREKDVVSAEGAPRVVASRVTG